MTTTGPTGEHDAPVGISHPGDGFTFPILSDESPNTANATNAISAERRAFSGSSTLVIEGDVIPRRLRRPADLMRFFLVFLAAAIVLGGAYFASGTASGIAKDIADASTNIPHLLVVIANLVGVFGVLVLPIASAIDLLLRKRGRQLLEAIVVMALTIAIVWAIAYWIQVVSGPQILSALTGRPTTTNVAPLERDSGRDCRVHNGRQTRRSNSMGHRQRIAGCGDLPRRHCAPAASRSRP